MKNNRITKVTAGVARGLAVALVAFVGLKANAVPHELAYAVDFNNNLIPFYTDAPGNLAVLPIHNITGLQNAEEVRGLDWWNGNLYGLGSSSRLYLIDPNTGAATQVGSGQFSPLLAGTAFGVDNGPSGVQVVSDQRQNLVVSRATGVASLQPALAYAPGDVHAAANPFVTALAYDSLSGVWYAGDSVQNAFSTLNPVTGLLTTLPGGGVAGIDFSRFNGLDVSASGTMYLASPAASSDPAANLYTVNKTTGAVTLVGLIGNPGDNILVRGFTVVAVPEPSALSMLALGGLLVGLIRRRK